MQTIPLVPQRTWARYFATDKLKKRLGVSWSKAGVSPDFTYYGKLGVDVVPSFNCRTVWSNDVTPTQEYGAVEITWYFVFRGFKPT